MNDMTFRPFDAKDYPRVVDIYNRMDPASPVTLDEAKEHNARFASDVYAHIVGELAGEVIAEYILRKGQLGENQLKLELYLHTDYATPERCQQLFNAAQADALRHAPQGLLTTVLEDWSVWLELLGREGFSELERAWKSKLDLTTFDPAPFAASLVKAEAAGIHFGTVAELPDNVATQRFLYDNIACKLLPTVPFTEPLNIYSFELWQERVWGNKHRNPESGFIAWHGQEMAGYSELYRTDEPQKMRTGLTAVLPAYRRKGIAMSLKLKAAAYAKANGITKLTTSNHSINRPMLAINEALGFVREAAWITLQKVIAK